MTKLFYKIALFIIKLYNVKGVPAFPLYCEIYFDLLEITFYLGILSNFLRLSQSLAGLF